MQKNTFLYTSATDLANLIRRHDISVVNLIEEKLSRMSEVNSKLNCFCVIDADGALEQARAADRAVASGARLGPLHGVPFAIKDLTPTKGLLTTMGSRAHRDWVPDHDAIIVQRLRAAGGVLVGKTTTPEFGHLPITRSPLWGVTRNPWNLHHTSGGSSGGSGAAVASGCVPIAEGSDMGGSIRIPASLCGIVGLKPSLGRIPFDILPSQFDSLSHFGPLARTVADTALFLSVTQGPDDGDFQSQVKPTDIPSQISGDIQGMRLAFSLDLGYYAIDDGVAANALAAIDDLRSAGAIVEEVDLSWGSWLNDAWLELWGVFMATFFGANLERDREAFDPTVVALIEQGMAAKAVDIKRIEMLRTRLWNSLAPILRTNQALICPTTSTAAPTVDKTMADLYYTDAGERYHGLDLTSQFNLLGPCPAISVPSGFTEHGMPTGLQIVGRRFDDVGILGIAAALERIRPWASRFPVI